MKEKDEIEHYFYGKGIITKIDEQKIYVNFEDYGKRIFKNNEHAKDYLASYCREIILDAAEQPSYRIIRDAVNAVLGTNYDGYQHSYKVIASSFMLWFPKLAKEKDGKKYPVKDDWMNVLSEDHSVIEEIKVSVTSEDPVVKEEPDRLVFAQDTNNTGRYIFRGLYTIVPEKTTQRCTTYRRVATRVKLTGLPADSIEILN